MAVFGLDPTIALAIGAVLIVLGLSLGFWGRGIWKMIMTLIGMALGGILGFIGGFAIGGITVGAYAISPYTLGLLLGLIGAFIGSILFAKVVNIALALVIGGLAAVVVFFSFGGPSSSAIGDVRLITAIIALFVVFAISYYFIEELLGLVTAAIGGLLVGVGVYVILESVLLGAAAGLGVFVVGMIVQTMKTRRQKRIAAALPPSPLAYPPSPPR